MTSDPRFATEEDLMAYAQNWEDNSDHHLVEDMDWVLIPGFPVALLNVAGDIERAEAWWDRQQAYATRNGWDYSYLLEEDIRDPIVIGVSEDGIEILDGAHRSVACALTDRPTVTAVVGIEKGYDPSELPDAVRDLFLTSRAAVPTP